MLIEAITNVRRELKFFEDVAGRYELSLEVQKVGNGVRMYRNLFNAVGEGVEKGERGVIEGLVLLWGTEKVYLEAWKFAKSLLEEQGKGGQDADGGALRSEFIPNWSSSEFEGFVDQIGVLAEEVWRAEGGEKEKVEGDLKGLWVEILEVEKAFWPIV